MRELAKFQDYFDIDAEIDFIFDEQVGEMNRILSAWEEFKNLAPVPNNHLGSVPIFRDEKKFLPLQAADMLAWFIRQRTVDGLSKKPPMEIPRFKGRRDTPFLFFPYTKADLTNLFKELTQDPRMTFSFGPWRYIKPLLPRWMRS